MRRLAYLFATFALVYWSYRVGYTQGLEAGWWYCAAEYGVAG